MAKRYKRKEKKDNSNASVSIPVDKDSILYRKLNWGKLNDMDRKILSILHKPEVVIVDSQDICDILDIPQNVVNRTFKKFVRMGLLTLSEDEEESVKIRDGIDVGLTADGSRITKDRSMRYKANRKRLGLHDT